MLESLQFIFYRIINERSLVFWISYEKGTMGFIKKGKYRHYKGNLYEVIDIALHSESLEEMVVYKELYGDFKLWVRSLKMFLENVEINGEIQKRFAFIEEPKA